MDLESLVTRHKELSAQIDELEKEKKAIAQAIMERMQDKSLRVGQFVVRRCQRLAIVLSVEEARRLNATKMEEAVDKEKIKALHHQGQHIAGVTQVHYIAIVADRPAKARA